MISHAEYPVATGPLGLPQLAAIPAHTPPHSALVHGAARVAQAIQWTVGGWRRRPGGPEPAHQGVVEATFRGLERLSPLLPRLGPVVATHRARWQIERTLAQRSRQRYERFLAIRRVMLATHPALTEMSAQEIYLNPANCWIRSCGRAAVSGGCGGTTLYFLVEETLRCVELDLEGQAVINELADYQPCTVAQWARLSALLDTRGILVLVRHLAGMGLVAFG